MFPPFTQLTDLLHRLRKPPVPPQALDAAESRVWQAVQARLESAEPMPSSLPTRSRFAFSPVLGFAFATVLLAALVVGIRYPSSSGSNQLAGVTPSTDAPDILVSQSAVQGHALAHSSGSDYGYVRRVQAGLPGVAFAADAIYDPTVFFRKIPVPITATSPTQIDQIDLTTNIVTPVTVGDSVDSFNPAFSTATQTLAYAESAVGQGYGASAHCDLVILDIASHKEVWRSTTGICYTPVSWSPDGRFLALVNTTDNNAVGRLAFYDANSRAITPVKTGLIPTTGGQWLDNTSFTMAFAEDNTFESFEQLYVVKPASDELTVLSGHRMNDIAKYQVVGGEVFYQPAVWDPNYVGKQIQVHAFSLKDPADDHAFQATSSDDGAGSFSVRLNSDGSLRSIVAAAFIQDPGQRAADPSSTGIVTFKEINAQTGEARTVGTEVKGRTLDTLILGWYGDYDHLLYWHSVDSTVPDEYNTTINSLDLATGESTVKVTGETASGVAF